MSMATFLPIKAADVNQTLELTPQGSLTDASDFIQNTHEADDGSIVVTTFSDQSYFDVTLQWDILTTAEAETIVALWQTTIGREKTFYWKHPSDGSTYVVRFMTPPTRVQTGSIHSYRGINSITLRVEGKKA